MNSTAQTELRRIMRSPKHEPPPVYPETAQPQNEVELDLYECNGITGNMLKVNPIYTFRSKGAQYGN